jgi:hypothetical protein
VWRLRVGCGNNAPGTENCGGSGTTGDSSTYDQRNSGVECSCRRGGRRGRRGRGRRRRWRGRPRKQRLRLLQGVTFCGKHDRLSYTSLCDVCLARPLVCLFDVQIPQQNSGSNLETFSAGPAAGCCNIAAAAPRNRGCLKPTQSNLQHQTLWCSSGYEFLLSSLLPLHHHPKFHAHSTPHPPQALPLLRTPLQHASANPSQNRWTPLPPPPPPPPSSPPTHQPPSSTTSCAAFPPPEGLAALSAYASSSSSSDSDGDDDDNDVPPSSPSAAPLAAWLSAEHAAAAGLHLFHSRYSLPMPGS